MVVNDKEMLPPRQMMVWMLTNRIKFNVPIKKTKEKLSLEVDSIIHEIEQDDKNSDAKKKTLARYWDRVKTEIPRNY